MFENNSTIVKTWVRLITKGSYTREQVPDISNLQRVVYNILDAEQENNV